MSNPLPVPVELRGTPRHVLEAYVSDRIRQFAGVFAGQLLGPDAVTGQSALVDRAMQQTLSLLNANSEPTTINDSYVLRFTHQCKFIGCRAKDCILCTNNPNKRCTQEENFQEAYADNQVLRSKCDSDIHIEVISAQTGQPADLRGAELQICVVDGESCDARSVQNARELRASDDGSVLIGWQSTDGRGDGMGRLLLRPLSSGLIRLPDVVIRDKNDTFHIENHTFATFRLKVVAVQYDNYTGMGTILSNVMPTVSEKFVVKTQRAMNDYSKNEFPNYRDELTKLKFIGTITAQRLKDVQSYVQDVPFTSIETVEQLKHLMQYSDQNRQVENKLLELLNMRGKHKYKWDFLREVLHEKIVYDDTVTRAWFCDEAMTQGLVYTCKQGQINLDRPFGVAQRVVNVTPPRLQVMPTGEIQNLDMLRSWRSQAEASWSLPQHKGWVVVQDPIELVNASGVPITSPRTSLADGLQGLEAMGDAYRRESMSTGLGLRPPLDPLNVFRRVSNTGISPGSRGEGSLPNAFSNHSASQMFMQQQGSLGYSGSPVFSGGGSFTGASSLPMGGFGALGDPNAPLRGSGGKSKAGARGRRASVDALGQQRRLSQGAGGAGGNFLVPQGGMGPGGLMSPNMGHNLNLGVELSSKSDGTMKRQGDHTLWAAQSEGLNGRPSSRSRVSVDPYQLDPIPLVSHQGMMGQGQQQPVLSPFGRAPSRFASSSIQPSLSNPDPSAPLNPQMTPEDIDRFLENSLGNLGAPVNPGQPMNFEATANTSGGSGLNSGSLPLMDRDSDMFKNKVSLNDHEEDLTHSAAAAAAAAVAAIDSMGADDEMFVPLGGRSLSKRNTMDGDSFNRFIQQNLLGSDTGGSSFK